VNDFVFGPDEKKMTLSSIKNNSEEKGLNDNEIKILEIMVEEALDPE
jgi:ribosomal protein L22